ncbi:ATP-dependent zinc metalloprotease YME1 [Nymphon striatum]|nr:ATP-dependent zinc metalloprotease YME1 [Nymphon striatum]
MPRSTPFEMKEAEADGSLENKTRPGVRKVERAKSVARIDDAKESEGMKTLLSDKKLPEEIKQKIKEIELGSFDSLVLSDWFDESLLGKKKVAFYEGYSANNSRTELKSKKKISGSILLFAVCIAITVNKEFSFSHDLLQNEIDPQDICVTFDDVKGVTEAKEELLEVIQYLKEPQKFFTIGGKLPKGVMLVGPPGTGKTLLAQAVAGEAGVPFFHVSGSEFDEVFVGQGAKRIRKLFSAAKKKAPCVIFIDEMDSVGAKRVDTGLHPYANQTINQLLSEMDGFKKNEGVIVLAATNRVDALDKALRRPGRFDVEVHVSYPNLADRTEILELYLKKIKTAPDVSPDELAQHTIGFSGAHLENMVNQAALKASTDGAFAVTMEYLNNAKDRITMGVEKKHKIPDEEANRITAYHEGGHALVAYFTKHAPPVHKVTIMPRGASLGHTSFTPDKDHHNPSKAELMGMLDAMMGGRAAEELVFGADYVTLGTVYVTPIILSSISHHSLLFVFLLPFSRALRRPGRFDVEVHVSYPNLADRTEILELYLKKIKTAPDVSPDELAQHTIGFSGAHLENMVNQAALKASTDGAFAVTMEYLNNAKDRITMGVEKKHKIPDEEANRITAYHEGGHALVAYFTKHAPPVHKVTIMPRGASLGHTSFTPDKDHHNPSKAELMGMLDAMMGGRAAEELVFGADYVTLGTVYVTPIILSSASDDLKKATTLVTQMVKELGMSEKVGLRTFLNDSETTFWQRIRPSNCRSN